MIQFFPDAVKVEAFHFADRTQRPFAPATEFDIIFPENGSSAVILPHNI
jgi:hypothetical protein